MLAWISAHIADRMFEPGSVDSYVGYLKRLACIDYGPNNSRHADKHDEMKIYSMGKAEAGYIILPSSCPARKSFHAYFKATYLGSLS